MRGSVYWYRLLNMQHFGVMNDFNCNRDSMIKLFFAENLQIADFCSVFFVCTYKCHIHIKF